MEHLNKMENKDPEEYIKMLKVEGGFTVPKFYFEQLPNKLNSINQETIIDSEIAKEVDGGFKVPTGYFEKMEGQVKHKTIGNGRKAKIISVFSVKHYLLAGIAAALLLSAFLFLWQDKRSLGQPEANRLEIDQVASHLEVGDLNEDLLCDAGWCDEISSLPGLGGDLPVEYLNEVETDLIIEEL